MTKELIEYDEPEGEECHTCEGTGEIIDNNDLEHTCPACDGSGFVDPGEPDHDDE
jgi:DnaJ-class molecular chaperone